MYVPAAFAETDQGKLHDFIEAYSFGLLVSTHLGEPFATHLPFLLERHAGPHGMLVGHMARANPHWQGLDGQPVLAVFSGPHAYVSPTWYEAENVVPTWNYVAVHAHGTCRLVDDAEALAGILARTVATYERSMPKPRGIDTDGEFFRKHMRAVVGFRVQVSRLEGKWKQFRRLRKLRPVVAVELLHLPGKPAGVGGRGEALPASSRPPSPTGRASRGRTSGPPLPRIPAFPPCPAARRPLQ
jgi:transcriptional regulator